MSSEEGIKYDEGKPRFSLIPADALLNVAEIFTKGAEKYGDNNWKLLEAKRILDGVERHINAHKRGYRVNADDWADLHLAHAAVGLLMVLQLELEAIERKEDIWKG